MLAWAAIDKSGAGVMRTDDELRELLGNLPEPLKREEVDDHELQEIAGARSAACANLPSACLPSVRQSYV
eukprot:COSAG02_NODE_2539_length_8577_cov_5.213730_4_plen_70_part_00